MRSTWTGRRVFQTFEPNIPVLQQAKAESAKFRLWPTQIERRNRVMVARLGSLLVVRRELRRVRDGPQRRSREANDEVLGEWSAIRTFEVMLHFFS